MKTLGGPFKIVMNLKENLSIAKEIAREAGDFLLDNKNKTKQIFSEEGRDIKLEIDRATETRIKKSLKDTGIPVLGEEFGGNSISENSYLWVIDPLDGTSNYFRGLDQCCVSIALLKGTEGLIGVIYNFNTDEMFESAKGMGAFLNGQKIKVSDVDKREKGYLTTGFPSSKEMKVNEEFISLLKEFKKVRMFGSAALSCAYIASGKCDFYTEKGVYIWDFAAGISLIEEAGGSVNFAEISEGRYSVSFSNGKI